MPEKLWLKEDPCEVEVQPQPNPAIAPKDAQGDVVQHTDPNKPAENAHPYDDIQSVTSWYNGYPLNGETAGMLADSFSGSDHPYLLQSLPGANWEGEYGGEWYPLEHGTLMPERTRKYTLEPAKQGLEFIIFKELLLFFSNGGLPNIFGSTRIAPGLAKSALQTADFGRDGFQFFTPGSWSAGAITITGENFSIQFQGAWSGMAIETATGNWGVWTAEGVVEISGNAKTVTLQGPADGETLALAVIAADGTPSEPQTITPPELGERFGMYTAAMPGWLTFEAWLGGPFTPFPPDANTLAWQILLDFDGDPATGATADFYAAQGLGYEVFFHSEGSSVFCGAATASGEDLECPKDLFRLTYDPAGRVVMRARIADLQAIAEQAGVQWNPATLRWRFSHINHALDGNPQDVFPEP